MSAGPIARAAYALGQGARLGVYWGQFWLAGRLTTPVKADRPVEGPMPDRARIFADLRKLLEQDWRNIEAGLYRLPHDLVETPLRGLALAPRYFADLPRVERRRHARSSQEVKQAVQGEAGDFPRYYLQNFHFQTDGYLSPDSAELYDHQVEILFGGGADAMRRQALVPLRHILKTRRSAETRLIDVACGTGRFLTFLKDNYPRLPVTALDLSPAYLDKARAQLRPWRGVDFLAANAEETGLPAESFELATCIYLFHELPRKVRDQVAREIFRLLKPGGRLVFLDSIQLGDEPDYDGLLERFPVAFHEPYYDDYVRQDLGALFEEAGFRVEEVAPVYFSRLMVLAKP